MKLLKTVYDSHFFTILLLSAGITVAVLSGYKHFISREPAYSCGDSYSCKQMNPKYEGLGDFPDDNKFLKFNEK